MPQTIQLIVQTFHAQPRRKCLVGFNSKRK